MLWAKESWTNKMTDEQRPLPCPSSLSAGDNYYLLLSSKQKALLNEIATSDNINKFFLSSVAFNDSVWVYTRVNKI